MALAPFKGISFLNPRNLCYCNSSINALLASNIISSNLIECFCKYCHFFYRRRIDSSKDQLSVILKNWIAQKNPEFQSTGQQDPSEFLNCLIRECPKFTRLTKSEIISSYTCSNCQSSSDDGDLLDRFKNIVHLNITGDSIADIVLNARTNVENERKRCVWCDNLNYHRKKQNWLILPSVLTKFPSIQTC